MITTEELGRRSVAIAKLKRQRENRIIKARTEYIMHKDLHKFAQKLRENQ